MSGTTNAENRNRGGGGGPALLRSPEVLRVLSNRNLLTPQELGRLLLFTSKSLTASAFATHGRDGVWSWICCSKWGADHAPGLIEGRGLGAEGCFRKLTNSNADIGRSIGPQPLRFSPADYLIIVNAFDQKDKTQLSKVIRGEHAPEFFEKGDLRVEIEHPLHVWEKEDTIHQTDIVDIVGSISGWRADVFLMRLPDQRCILAMHKLAQDLDSYLSVVDDGKISAYFCIAQTGLLPVNRYGRDLVSGSVRCLDRVEMDLQLDYGLTTTSKSNDTRVLSGFTLSSEFSSSEDDDDSQAVSEVLSSRKRTRQNLRIQRDVTFAHILEALDIWHTG